MIVAIIWTAAIGLGVERMLGVFTEAFVALPPVHTRARANARERRGTSLGIIPHEK